MENDWCIRLTNDNRDIVVNYFKNKDYCIDGYINRYYGVMFNNFANEDIRWGTELTTEQFIEKIKSEGYNVGFHKSDLDLNITPKQIQSDGGSTPYYQIEITNSNGEKLNCELNDILRDVFNNQWDLCNIVKASRRISEARKGKGKKDVSIKYDANKIIWFAEEIKKYGK